ncbi:MAG: ABC transporter ATP-binding protein [Pseudomonadota bacterium]
MTIDARHGRSGRLYKFRFLWQILRSVPNGPLWFALLWLTALLAAASEVVTVLFSAPIIDMISGQKPYESVPLIGPFVGYFHRYEASDRLVLIAGAMMILVIMRGLMLFASSVLTANFVLRINQILALRYYGETLTLSMAYLDQKSYSHFANLLTGQIGRVAEIIRSISDIVASSTLIPIYFVILINISVPSTLGALVFVAFTVLALKFIARWQVDIGRRVTIVSRNMSQHLADTIIGVRTVKLLQAEPLAADLFRKLSERNFSTQRLMSIVSNVNGPLTTTAGGLVVALLILGVGLGVDGTPVKLLGEILIFLIVLTRMVGPASNINQAIISIMQNFDGINDLLEFETNARRNVEPSGPRRFEQGFSLIEYKGINFSYKARETSQADTDRVLRDISFELPQGSMLALVGPSGSGKSTVASLLCKLYRPISGQILVDGIELDSIRLSDWRDRIGFVTQEVFLIDGTVRDNLCFGQGEVSQEEIERATRAALAHDFIMAMEQGYDTRIGQSGGMLSGGERQRLSIARMLLRNPQLLILDEATSSLDSHAEAAMREMVNRLRGRSTILVIAHRLVTVTSADRILVLRNGQITESGTHNELLAADQYYAEMVRLQDVFQ